MSQTHLKRLYSKKKTHQKHNKNNQINTPPNIMKYPKDITAIEDLLYQNKTEHQCKGNNCFDTFVTSSKILCAIAHNQTKLQQKVIHEQQKIFTNKIHNCFASNHAF